MIRGSFRMQNLPFVENVLHFVNLPFVKNVYFYSPQKTQFLSSFILYCQIHEMTFQGV